MALKNYENTETNKHVLTVSVAFADFDKACNDVYEKQKEKIKLQGFRPGKAPRKMIEKQYGEGVFFEDAIDIVYPDALSDAIEEKKLDVVGVEKLEPKEVGDGKDFVFEATVITKPAVEIDGYKGIKVSKTVKTVTDKEVDEQIANKAETVARTVEVSDRAAKDGDIVDIDFDGYEDGVAFEGGKAEHFKLTLGSGQFIPGFEGQIEGKEIGAEFDVTVTFPEDYDPAHAGKEAVFKCKLHGIEVKELPAIDDELAKDISEFDTLKELKADIKSKIEANNAHAAEHQVEDALITALAEKVVAEIPEVMFEQQTNDLIHSFEHRLSSQGMSLEMYMQYTGMDADAMRAQFAEQSKTQVKLTLALEKIAEIEKLDASDADVEAEIAKMAEEYKMSAEDIKARIPLAEVKKDLTRRNAQKFVEENAVIDESGEAPKKKAPAKKVTAEKSETAEKKPAAKKPAAKKTTTTTTTKKPAAKKPAAKKPSTKVEEK